MARLSKSAFIVEEHDVLDKAKVLRTGQSGDVYQLRMWVPDEKKYLRETLRTRDLATAMDRAEERVFQIYSDIKSGRKIFGATLSELVSIYLDWRLENDVKTGNITSGRLVTIRSQLKHLIEFKGGNTKVSELDKSSCYEYATWRRKNNTKVKDDTIRNEKATINHLIKFAYRNGYAHFSSFDFRQLRFRHEEGDKRDTFTLEEYDRLVRFMRIWVSKKATGSDERLQRDRLLIRDCILIASNTMLRVGELWQLKWKDIVGYETTKDERGKKVELVTLKVRGETSKNRKNRIVTSRGGEYFKRIRERTDHKDDEDYIFCGSASTEIFPRRKLYASWKELMNGVDIDYKERNLTWYSLRHFGITCRLRAGASIFDIAKIAGTSVSFIEDHYGHFDQAMAKAVALKNFSVTRDGITVR
jgi:integrase